jgi:competence protein ComGC
MKSNLFKEESGASDFGQVYMILIFAIVALLLILIVKPMFQQSQKAIPKTG